MPPCRSELVNKINWFFDLNNLYHRLEASKIKKLLLLLGIVGYFNL